MGNDSKNEKAGTSLVVQWLRLHASTVGGTGQIPGQGTKLLYAMWRSQKRKKKKKKQERIPEMAGLGLGKEKKNRR